MRLINPLLVLLLCGYVAAFAYFRAAHTQEKNRTKQAIGGLLRNESLAGNTYALSKSVLDLERLGLISCSIIYENGTDGSIFYNSSSNEKCVRNITLRPLFEDEMSLKAINGTLYFFRIQMPIQWQLISTELLTYLLLGAWLIIYLRHTETQRIKSAAAQALVQHSLQISHDIRAPIAVLSASLAHLKFSNNQDREIFDRALYRLMFTANGLLAKFKNESNESSKTSRVSLGDIVEELIRENSWMLRSTQSTKSIELENSLGDHFLILSDENRIRLIRAIQNLVQNAIEASREEDVVKILSFKDGEEAVIEIRDNGPGIPKEILTSIGVEVVSGKAGGTGLGFLSAKNFIEAIGGKLSIQSAPSGTNIRITFKTSRSKLDLVVLIDDDVMIRDLWMRTAKRNDIRLESFESMRDFSEAKVKKDCAIYLDVERGDNISTCEAVSRLQDSGYKRIWICTAHPNFEANGISGILGIVGKEPPWL